MRYQISGKQLKIGESLQIHVKQELDGIAAKYAERPTEANITFSKDRHEFVCESSIHLSTGLTVNAEAHATEIYGSFDSCGEKMEKQLRRYKRRLKDHNTKNTTPVETFDAPSYTAANDYIGGGAKECDAAHPMIIAETKTEIKPLSVEAAVRQMELAKENVLVFQNEGQKRVNVVYKRSDGNIGWIDPE